MSRTQGSKARHERDDHLTLYTKDNLTVTKRRVKRVAKDLCYPKIVLRKIDEATTDSEIDFIMKKARIGDYDCYSKEAI